MATTRPVTVIGLFVAALVATVLAACSDSATVVRPDGTSGAPGPATATPATTTTRSATTPSATPSVTVTPARGLAARQTVLVSAQGFTPGEQLQVVQCAARGAGTGPGDCNLSAMQPASADATGRVRVRLVVVRGPFGARRVVCSRTTPCLVSVTQASFTPTEEADAPISFAARP